MSVVLACALPLRTLIFSDSRVTLGEKYKRDELQKIFQLAPHLVVGFTSNNVTFTHAILNSLGKYSHKKSRSQNTLYLLNRLYKVANYEYKNISEKFNKKPEMEFVFAGVVRDRMGKIPKEEFWTWLKQKQNNITLPNGVLFGSQYQYDMETGIMVEPPLSIILKQSFPSGQIELVTVAGFSVSGSGSGVGKKLDKDWANIFLAPTEMQLFIFQGLIENYAKENKIETVGGLTQTIQINKDGVMPIGHIKTEINKDGTEGRKQSMTFENGTWIQYDSSTNKKIAVYPNPFLLNKNFEDNEFPKAKSNLF